MAAKITETRGSSDDRLPPLEADSGNRGGVNYRFGMFEVQPAAGLLLQSGHRVRIQDLPFRLLVILLETPGAIVSREELRNRLWGENTFVEFDNNLRVAAAKLREALRDSASKPQFVETIARRGYRFLATVEVVPLSDDARDAGSVELEADASADPMPEIEPPAKTGGSPQHRYLLQLSLGIAAILLIGMTFGLWRWKHRPLLVDGDSVALGAIQNETGDPSLNDSLSLAFRVKMEESPFLHTISFEQFERNTLRLRNDATRKMDEATAELAVCKTSGGKLLLHGRLERSGSAFTARLMAQRCTDGRDVATTSAFAGTAPALLQAIGEASDRLRLRLGETPSMLVRFDVPLTQATTDSLAALRAFRAGEQLHVTGHDLESRENYKLAIDLDSRFAIAYLQLGRSYSNTGELSLSRSYYQKAFDLRERTTDREKLYITTSYYSYATGEIDRAIGAYQLWMSLYPHDVVPANNLATEYLTLGEGDKAVVAARRAIETEPLLPVPYAVLAQALLMTGDYRTLSALCADRERASTTSMSFHLSCHELAIVSNDTARQAEQEQQAKDKPQEGPLLNDSAEAEAFRGRLAQSKELFAQSVASARAHGLPELAAVIELNGAGTRAELGDSAGAAALIHHALDHPANGADAFLGAAMTWSMLGNQEQARELAGKAAALEPTNTILNQAEIPVVLAVAALKNGRPQEAARYLSGSRAYDRCAALELMPEYYRGLALLGTGNRQGAQAEFEGLLSHQTIRPRSIYVVLAKLELAKIYAANNEGAKAASLAADLQRTWAHADANFAPLHALNKAFPR